MSKNGFGAGTVVNRRVNKHLKTLIPDTAHQHKDYHLEGQRTVPPNQSPGKADECLCHLEVYLGTEGQFAVYQERRFDHVADNGWCCKNKICRTESEHSAVGPFTYSVKTTVNYCGKTQTDRSRVPWSTLDADPIYGGLEAQAATLLAEKMAHYKAVENEHNDHCGSLSRLGSLSAVVDNNRCLEVEWDEIDAILGPDANTIAASTGFDPLSNEHRVKAEQKGIDFLSDDVNEELSSFKGRRRASRDDTEATDECHDSNDSWKTPPEGMTPAEAEATLSSIQERLASIRSDLCDDS